MEKNEMTPILRSTLHSIFIPTSSKIYKKIDKEKKISKCIKQNYKGIFIK